MNKYFRYGLLFLSIFSIFVLMVGCSLFGGLDDAQQTGATFVNALFAKTNQPSVDVRYQKLVSTISPNMKDSIADPQYKSLVISSIQEAAKKGLYKDYFIANHPTEPQTDTHRVIVIKFPKGSISSSTGAFGSDGNTKDTYGEIVLNKEGDNWKIIELKDVDANTMQKANIDWKEVSPTDYLN